MVLERLCPDMRGKHHRGDRERVEDADRHRERQRPGQCGIAGHGIGERPHQDRKGRRIVILPAVIVDDLVERIAGPHCPCGAEKHLHVAELVGPVQQDRQIDDERCRDRDHRDRFETVRTWDGIAAAAGVGDRFGHRIGWSPYRRRSGHRARRLGFSSRLGLGYSIPHRRTIACGMHRHRRDTPSRSTALFGQSDRRRELS